MKEYHMKRPEKGVRFTAKIDRISSSGNGIIETENGHINIGPVKEDSIGKEIEATMETSMFARCHIISALPRGYRERFGELIEPSSNSTGNQIIEEENELVGNEFTVEIIRTGPGGVPIAEHKGKPVHVPGAEVGSQVKIEITSDKKTFAMGEVISENSDENKEYKVDEEKGSIEEVSNDKSNKTGKTYADFFKKKQSSSKNMEHLRKQANEAAVDEVPQKSSIDRQKTPEYTRSRKVREYVLARANGSCEGCGDSAPFISKTGDPYLHAHHIHELSDGGSDTPDTVVALCPNCHYRVHHGKDGDSYNQELLKIVQEIEDQ